MTTPEKAPYQAEAEQPLQERYAEQMRNLGAGLNKYLNPEWDPQTGPPSTGFMLLVFSIGEANPESRMNYIANTERDSTMESMFEFLCRAGYFGDALPEILSSMSSHGVPQKPAGGVQ